MPLTLLVHANELSAPRELTFDAPRLVIGRGEGSDLRLPDPSVSHRHASIRQRGSEYIVMDEGSTNGTFVGPVKLSPGAPRVIATGERIRIGRLWLEARITMNPPTAHGAQATKEMALALLAEALAAQGEDSAPTVRITAGPDQGKALALSEFHRPYIIGRLTSADLPLDETDASRRHLSIVRKGDQLFVQDLGSKNGSLLAGTPLAPNKETPWPSDADLTIGADTLSYVDPVREALRELEHVPDEPLAKAELFPEPAAAPSAASPPLTAPRPSARQRQPDASGWNPSDLLVAALALLVLGVSALGLYWLLGSN